MYTEPARYIDNYRNPHMYTRSAISRATGENQYALGRALGLEVCHSQLCFWYRAHQQSFRRQLEDSIGSEFPSIPLPPRRHQPILPNSTSDETEINGTRENGAMSNGEVKLEEMTVEADNSVDNRNVHPTTNGTHP
jgi:mediator of RNA polymerase II transcription subunit 10